VIDARIGRQDYIIAVCNFSVFGASFSCGAVLGNDAIHYRLFRRAASVAAIYFFEATSDEISGFFQVCS
jgi:hypothetical protein